MALNLVQHRGEPSIWDPADTRWNEWDAERWLAAAAAGLFLAAGLRRRSLAGLLFVAGGGSLMWWAAAGADERRIRRARLQAVMPRRASEGDVVAGKPPSAAHPDSLRVRIALSYPPLPTSTPTPTPSTITRLLRAWSAGDASAGDALMPLVYDELRRRARRYLRRERREHTLEPTALVHEAYMRLVDQREADWRNRTQFYAVAAVVIRTRQAVAAVHSRPRAPTRASAIFSGIQSAQAWFTCSRCSRRAATTTRARLRQAAARDVVVAVDLAAVSRRSRRRLAFAS